MNKIRDRKSVQQKGFSDKNGVQKKKGKWAPQRKFKITCNNGKADLNDSQFKLASVTKCQFYSCETK